MKKVAFLILGLFISSQAMADTIDIRAFTGQEAKKYIAEIAHIRITLFKEYPYLYAGTIAYEEEYLETYFSSPDATVLLVFDNNEVVGFSNSIPLCQESPEIKAPFIQKGLNLNSYLYIGEAMLYPPYRSKGILRKISDFHEIKARNEKYPYLIFMTVQRPDNHASRPSNYQSLDPICRHFGYELIPGLEVHLAWTQVDTHRETDNILAIWQKSI